MLMRRYFRIVILLCLLACITAGASALSREDCEESGGWYADVHSNPGAGANVVTTPILDEGRIYYITTAEIFWPDYQDNVQADAQFYSMDDFSTWLKPAVERLPQDGSRIVPGDWGKAKPGWYGVAPWKPGRKARGKRQNSPAPLAAFARRQRCEQGLGGEER
jgi:hypothetical protein